MRESNGKHDAGLTLIEMLIAMTIFSIGGLAVAGAMSYSLRLNAVNRETALATQEANRVLEEIRALTLEDVIKTYNSLPDDDLEGYGTSPGNLFTLDSLSPPDGQTGGASAEVFLPFEDGLLLENLSDTALGTVGDLSGDGKVDGKDHLADFKILPVAVRIRWKGATGDRELNVHTVLRR